MDEHRRISKLEVQVGELQAEVKDLKEDVKILTGLIKQADERFDSLVWALRQKGVKVNEKPMSRREEMSREWFDKWIDTFNSLAIGNYSYWLSLRLKEMLREAGVKVEK